MKKLYTLLFILSSLRIIGQTSPLLLQQSSPTFSYSNSIATTLDKSIIISGNTDGGITLGANTLNYTSAYVTKYDSLGQNMWIIPTGKYIDTERQRTKMPRAILDSNDDIYVLGEFDDTCFIGSTVLTDTGVGNSFLAKVNSSGVVVWARKLTDNNVTFFDMTRDSYGNLFITGYINGTLYLGNDTLVSQGYDILLIKLDSSGNLIWMKKAGGPSSFPSYSEIGFSVSTDNYGNCFITGYLRSLDPTFDSIVIPINSAAGYTGFVAKYDSSGNVLWAKKCGYQSSAISSDSVGNTIATGYTYNGLTFDTTFISGGSGSSKAFVASINPNGSLKWAQLFNADYSEGFGAANDNNGNCFVIGTCRDTTVINGPNITLELYNVVYPSNFNCGFIIKFDSIGDPISGNLVQNSTNFFELHDVNYRNCNLSFTGNFGTGQPIYYNNDSLQSIGTVNGFAIVQDGCSPLITNNESIQSIDNVILYPNPFNDRLIIETNNFIGSEISLYDIFSRKVLHKKFTNSISLSTEHLARGLYLYEVRDKNSLYKKGMLLKN